MDFLVGMFFLWILFNVFSGFVKKTNKSNKPTPWNTPRRDTYSQTRRPEDVKEAQEFEELKSRVKSISKQQAVQFARKAAQKKASGLNDDGDIPVIDPSKNRDMQDKNMSRREDWGSRAGPGILSTPNILIFIALALVGILLVEYLSLL